MSDRIAVMNGGVIEQLAEPMEIYNHPLTRFVAGFIGETNLFDGTVKAVNGKVLDVETPAGMLQVEGEGFAAGEEMHISIRPEFAQISKTPVPGFAMEGTIRDFIYMGTVVKTIITLKDGSEFRISRFEQETELKEGDTVYACWKPEKAVAIKQSAS